MFCEYCIITKSHPLHFTSTTMYKTLLELLFSDI